MGEWFERNGIPVLARLEAPALADGGDLLWLDSRTLVIGRGFRTNEAGARAIETAVGPFVDAVHVVDLPIDRGADFCLHTLSLISMLDRDLAVVSLPLMPVHLWELLRERGVELIEIAEQEWDSLAPNVLALGPRDVVMLAGNPLTSKGLCSAGCRVREIEGSDVAIKGSGGPTCLTLPLQRDTV
jgi:N-dimethylarginine dimethylaminohydrolase